MTDGYTTLDWAVEDGILTLTLDRPDQLNAFTVTMADELEHAFDRASLDDEVRAVVVTGRGRAFCAGMDLSSDGNVFGLDETQRPTLDDLRDRFDDPAVVDGVRDTGGRVTLAIYRCTKPVIGALNGAGGRDRRDDDAADGRPARVHVRAHRLRLRPARDRARGGVVVVPAAHRGHQPGPGVGLHRRHPRARTRPSPAGWCGPCTPRTSCSARRTTWPGGSPSTAPPSRSRWPGR